MAGKILDNGTLITLGLVAAVAAVGAANKAGLYGSRSMGKRDIRSWLEARVHALPLPPDANVRVLRATLESHVLEGVPQEVLKYELGAYIRPHSTLSSYHPIDLHEIVKDALDVDEAWIDGESEDWDSDAVVWSAAVYADGDALSRRVRA